MRKETTASFLTYAGGLPFAAYALLELVGWSWGQADPEHALRVYSALIVSFVGGIHWQIVISERAAPGYVLWASNAAALSAWWIVIVHRGALAWTLFAVLLAVLLAVDHVLRGRKLLAPWFYRLRVRISAVVVLSLLVAATAA